MRALEGLAGTVQLSGAKAILRIDPAKHIELLNAADVENLIREWQQKLEYMRKVEAALSDSPKKPPEVGF